MNMLIQLVAELEGGLVVAAENDKERDWLGRTKATMGIRSSNVQVFSRATSQMFSSAVLSWAKI